MSYFGGPLSAGFARKLTTRPNFYMSLRSIQNHLRRRPARLALESFRNTLHRISGPLPLPTAHEIVALGGGAGEREGQGETKRL